MSNQLKITFPANGELLNRTHGEVISKNKIAINVRGIAAPGSKVKVNGIPTEVAADGSFSAKVTLDGEFPVVKAEDGVSSCEVHPAVNTDSSKRYNFFIDDNIFFFSDLVKNSKKSIFDNFYLAGLRKLNEKYGFRVTLNTFFRNDHWPFDLSEVSDIYSPEFEANSSWLRFAFHAYSEFPGSPYTEHFPEKVPEHYEIVVSHLKRIVGEKAVTPPAIIHFFDVDSLEGRKFLHSKGMNVFSKFEKFWDELNAKHGRRFFAFYDSDDNMYKIPVEIILDRFKIPDIEEKLDVMFATPGKDFVNLGTHEQYANSFYSNYIPEYFDRVELAVRSLTEKGYRPVFANEGSFGV